MIRRAMPTLLMVAALATTACVSGGYYRSPTVVRTVDDRAYARGYDEGRFRGESDARSRRRFDYTRHAGYRRAGAGYRGFGDLNAYRSLFRQGFVDGYNAGYRRFGGPGPASRSPAPGYDPSSGYPGVRGLSPAADNGFRDGYEQGRDDARDRDRYDPVRASRYRSGDHSYNSRYGSREDYKREYRAAFQQGYDRGYREHQR